MDTAAPARTREWDRDVADFLRAHPGWLAAHPDLYRCLTPPARIHGEAVADHLAAMVLRERRHADQMTEQAEAVLAAGRSAAATIAQVQQAVLALIAAPDLIAALHNELPRLLCADAVAVCRHGRSTPADHLAAALDAWLGTRNVAARDAPPDAPVLYREAAALARHDVLVRLPGHGVLGLASRDGAAPSSDARRHLGFLGQVVATLLDTHPGEPAAA